MPSLRTVAASSVLAVFLLLVSGAALGGHAPTIFYRAGNDAVNTDRFSSPLEAAQMSIERAGPQWRLDHVEQVYSYMWIIHRYMVYPDGTQSSVQSWNSIQKWQVCDATPMIGPQYQSTHQGMESTRPDRYLH